MTLHMTPEVYEQKRNELVELLDEVITLVGDIPVLQPNRDKTLDELRRTRRRVFENQFTIALMARFQGGKSTTFNALCDGMEISPRGTNIKTSATVITAQNTVDEAEAGTAEIVWRSDRELALVFADLVLPHLRQKAPERFRDCATADAAAGVVDFKVDQDMLLTALVLEWGLWRKDKASYTSERLDALRIGSIICEYIFSDGITSLKAKEDYRVSDIGPLVRFPDEWEKRFAAGDAKAFGARECCFAFIREVRCKVRSRNLARTGSVVIDCPGLFASRYDTLVARDILARADAVWFLCGGRALSESELAMIREAARIRADKPFFTINMMETTRNNIVRNIRPADAAAIRQHVGIELEDEELLLYQALLALCAVQGEKLLTGGIDPHTGEAIRDMYHRLTDEEPESVEFAWTETVQDQLNSLKVQERDSFTGLNDNGVAISRTVSGLDGIVAAVEGHVIQKKAEAILVGNGAGRVEKELRQFEGELKAVEEDAILTARQAEEEYDKAEGKLTAFHAFSRDQMDKLGLLHETIDKYLAKNFWDDVFLAAVDAASHKAAAQIVELPKRWLILGPSREEVKTIVLESFASEAEVLGQQWQSYLQAGKNEQFNYHLHDKISFLNALMQKEWDVVTHDATRLQSLPEPHVSPVLEFSTDTLQNVGSVKNAAFRKDLLFMTGGVILGAALGFFLGGPLGVAIAICGDAIIGFFKAKSAEAVAAEVFTGTVMEVASAYKTALDNERDKILAMLSKQLSQYRYHYVDSLNAIFNEQTRQLSAMRQEALASFKQKESDRTAKAEMCHTVRITKIKPTREKLRAFLHSLTGTLPERREA